MDAGIAYPYTTGEAAWTCRRRWAATCGRTRRPARIAAASGRCPGLRARKTRGSGRVACVGGVRKPTRSGRDLTVGYLVLRTGGEHTVSKKHTQTWAVEGAVFSACLTGVLTKTPRPRKERASKPSLPELNASRAEGPPSGYLSFSSGASAMYSDSCGCKHNNKSAQELAPNALGIE